jgi:hypothetical protein
VPDEKSLGVRDSAPFGKRAALFLCSFELDQPLRREA